MDILGLRAGRADANLPASSRIREISFSLLLAFLILFTPFIKGPIEYLNYTLVFLSASALLFFWLVTSIHRGSLKVYFTPLAVAPIIFLALIVTSSLYTINPSATRYGLLAMGSFIIVCLVTGSIAPDKRLWRSLIWVVVIISTLLSLYALFQYSTRTGNFMGRAHATFVNPNSF